MAPARFGRLYRKDTRGSVSACAAAAHRHGRDDSMAKSIVAIAALVVIVAWNRPVLGQGAVEDVGDRVEEAADDARDTVEEAAEDAGAAVEEAAEDAAAGAED